MKRTTLWSLLLLFVAAGCGLVGQQTGKNGELTGVMKRPAWDNPNPLGMVPIPAGSFHMGQNDQDVTYSQIAHNRQITMSGFYMDETEIENNEYRQFVNFMVDNGSQPLNSNTSDSYITYISDYLKANYDKEMGTSPEEVKNFVYPDTLVWIRDFTYAYNEPLTENYYWHPAFDKYPVVGTDWYQAQAFCLWRSLRFDSARIASGRMKIPRFRLPTEAEWEYAARGGFEHKIYPWPGPYIRNSRGCLFANYKPGRGDYIADNYEYTCPVNAYWPNDYGLYNMPGNVAEWCEDDYEESGYTYAHDLNPVYRDPTRKNSRRVIRGGSWKDVGYYLSVGSRTYEYADTNKSFVGFRCVTSLLGRSRAAQGGI